MFLLSHMQIISKMMEELGFPGPKQPCDPRQEPTNLIELPLSGYSNTYSPRGGSCKAR